MLVAIVIGIIAEQNDRLKNELQKITNAMLDIVMQVRYDGNIEYITPSVETVLGFSPPGHERNLFIQIYPS
ncbi:MAG: hypothetical protein H5T98_03900 [Syntrophomonadaceae bacterium]|nr:hypothetical protein [Syntrophomonadaceae bacterium]